MNPNNLANPTQTHRPTMDDTTAVVCDSCKGILFQPGVFIRKLSPLLSEDGRPAYIPIPNVAFYCVKCGHVNDEFIPPQLKEKNKVITIS